MRIDHGLLNVQPTPVQMIFLKLLYGMPLDHENKEAVSFFDPNASTRWIGSEKDWFQRAKEQGRVKPHDPKCGVSPTFVFVGGRQSGITTMLLKVTGRALNSSLYSNLGYYSFNHSQAERAIQYRLTPTSLSSTISRSRRCFREEDMTLQWGGAHKNSFRGEVFDHLCIDSINALSDKRETLRAARFSLTGKGQLILGSSGECDIFFLRRLWRDPGVTYLSAPTWELFPDWKEPSRDEFRASREFEELFNVPTHFSSEANRGKSDGLTLSESEPEFESESSFESELRTLLKTQEKVFWEVAESGNTQMARSILRDIRTLEEDLDSFQKLKARRS